MVNVYCIGRVGALAIALGVGAALASVPVVASAAPESSSSSPDNAGADSAKGSAKPGGTGRAGTPKNGRSGMDSSSPGAKNGGTATTRRASASGQARTAAVADHPVATRSVGEVARTEAGAATAPGAATLSTDSQARAAGPPAATMRPLPTPGGDTVSPVMWTVLAYARREIDGVARAAAAPSQDVGEWLRTYVNFEPWVNGTVWFPKALRPLVFHASPVARPMQVQVDLRPGQTSAAIPFNAYSPDGGGLFYSVPGQGKPGAPAHGTVTVDNSTGSFTYTPDQSFTGTDSFSYVANDGIGLHLHAWEGLFNDAFGILGLAGGHRATETVTVFNGVPIQPDPKVPQYTPITGDFTVLTYGVGGMPYPLPGGPWPRIGTALDIGSRLNAFDIVNVQQDLAYHPWLAVGAAFPDRTAPSVPTWAWPLGVPFSDGLNSFSAYQIESLQRQTWTSGTGGLLVPQGFTYSRQHIPGGSSVDVYNVDTDWGALGSADIAQLSAFIQRTSTGRAVIVTGDFGQLYSDPGQTLGQFAVDNGLTDAWVQLEYNGSTPVDAPTCAYSDKCEQPDKVFYRSAAPLKPGDPASNPVRLQVTDYTNEGLDFRNGAGQDLSGHRPQSVAFAYTVDAVGPATVDLANWMGTLPGLADLPLTQLPFPGTHDSGSYGITSKSAWALTGLSDFGVLTQLPDFIVKPIAADWSKTQSKDLYGQFQDGIRYVDLRLSNEPNGQIYIEHGLRGPTIDDVLSDIARYADSHPKEVVIVDAGRFTNFTPETHALLLAKVQAAFGPRMAPRSLGTSATLADFWAIDKNVIVIYNDATVVKDNPDLWYSSTIYGPWANVQSIDALEAANARFLAQRDPADIWSMAGTPTPDTTNIVVGLLTLGPMSNRGLMWQVHPALQQWLRVNFKDSVNLVNTDWYDVWWPVGSSYSRDVIGAVYETLGSRLP